MDVDYGIYMMGGKLRVDEKDVVQRKSQMEA